MEWIADPTAWLGLSTLVLLEIILGIDNLIFIAILSEKLPPHLRDRARVVGLSMALVLRLVLLASISWLVTLTDPLFSFVGQEFSGRDLIFLIGGMFLLFKATMELHERLEIKHPSEGKVVKYADFWTIIAQIVVLDAVFSIDSVITAVGMVHELTIMMLAVIIAILVMMAASKPLTRFVNAHPTLIVLCLGFLMMIGFSLIADGLGFHIPKGYLYAAIGFSVLVESFNQFARAKKQKAFGSMSLRERTAEAVFHLLGGRGRETIEVSDDIAVIAGTPSEEPVFEPEEIQMLDRVLRLHDIGISSVMTHRQDTVWIEVNESRQSILAKVRDSRHSRYPLCEGTVENILGIVTVKDLLLHTETDNQPDLRNCMKQPISLLETANVLDALDNFKQSTASVAIVVDEYGEFQGLVTLKDIMEAIVGTLPEPAYRGEYTGEMMSDGNWLLDGGLPIYKAEELLNAKNMGDEADDYNTVAGFILHQLGRIPKNGDSLAWNGLIFTVTNMDRHRIDKVHVLRDNV